jgi:hypothetical protein
MTKTEALNQPLNQQTVVIVVEKNEYDSVPQINSCVAMFILILNCILPGWGTIVLACVGGRECGCWFLTGIAQFLLCPIIIGWVWSILTGCKVLSRSRL